MRSFVQPDSRNSGFHSPACNLKQQLVLQWVGIDADVIAMKHLAVQNLDSQGILDQTLDSSLQRTSPVLPVIPGQQQLMTRTIGQFQSDLARLQQLAQIAQSQIDNVLQWLLTQRTENHHIIDTVEELRPKSLP